MFMANSPEQQQAEPKPTEEKSVTPVKKPLLMDHGRKHFDFGQCPNELKRIKVVNSERLVVGKK
jgi:hypothetical protein